MAQAAALLEEYDTHQADVSGEVLVSSTPEDPAQHLNKGNAGPEPADTKPTEVISPALRGT
jgi:hypothetical protein